MYGTFPSAATADDVRRRTGTTLAMGTTSSNDYLRQLLASDLIKGGVEQVFYAQGKNRRPPDENWVGSRALEPGECGFAYIPGLHSGSPLDFPVVIGPLIHGTDKIDPKPGKGKGAVCLVDGTVAEASVDRDGHVMIRGKRLLDPTNPIWGGKPPTLVWPE